MKINSFKKAEKADKNGIIDIKNPTFQAPESIQKMPYDGFKADVWSAGVVLY